MSYTDAHRAFLQLQLQHRILTQAQVNETFKQICSHFDIKNASLVNFIKEINNQLIDLHIAIKKSIQEGVHKDVSCLVIVNNLNNDFTRSCSSFSKSELAFMKKLVEVLIVSEEGSISETSVINISVTHSIKMAAGVIENLITKLIEEKWLLSENGQISLSALTICELEMYIEANFEKYVMKCYFCARLVFKGYSCPECEACGHRSCLKKYWAEMKNSETICPRNGCDIVIEVEEMGTPKRTRLQTSLED